jgi:hypothetical protein
MAPHHFAGAEYYLNYGRFNLAMVKNNYTIYFPWTKHSFLIAWILGQFIGC